MSRVWFDDGDNAPGDRPMGRGYRDACICPTFFGAYSRDGSRHRIADRLPEKAFDLDNRYRAPNGNNRNRYSEHADLLATADFHIIKNTN